MTGIGNVTAPGQLRPITGIVKWYDPKRGYGFVVPDGGGREAIIHAARLKPTGIVCLMPDDRVECEVFDREPGPAVWDIRFVEEGSFHQGTIYGGWFNLIRGYGFMTRSRGQAPDVFIHITTLQACGLGAIEPDVPYIARYSRHEKGLAVDHISSA